jgi:hypothetical protein
LTALVLLLLGVLQITLSLRPLLVDRDDLEALKRKFQAIDKDGNGSLSIDEFLLIPELAGNPLLQRVISIFDQYMRPVLFCVAFVSVPTNYVDTLVDTFLPNDDLIAIIIPQLNSRSSLPH